MTKISILKCLLLLLFFIISIYSKAIQPILYNTNQNVYHLHNQLDLLTDRNSTVSEIDVLKATNFKPYDSESVQVGISSYWIRFSVINPNNEEILSLNTAYFDSVEVYKLNKNRLILQNKTGFLIKPKKNIRKVYRTNLCEINLAKKSETVFYVKLYSKSLISQRLAKLSFSEGFDLLSKSKVNFLFFRLREYSFFIIGAIFIIFVLNIFLAIKGISKVYYWLALYNLSFIITYLNSFAFTVSSGLIENVEVVRYLRFILSIIIALTYFYFAIEYLDLKKYLPKIYKLIRILNILILLSFPIYFLGYYNFALEISGFISVMIFPILYFSVYKTFKVNKRNSLIFIFGSLIIVSALMFFLQGVSVEKADYYFNEFIMLAAALLEIIVFTYALADDYNRKQIKLNELEIQKHTLLEKNLKTELELERKHKELLIHTTSQIEKQKKHEEVLDILTAIQSERVNFSTTELNTAITKVKQMTLDNSFEKKFQSHFIDIEKGFKDRLFKIHPNLTANDIILCCYLKLNLSSLEIAKLQGVEQSSINQSRYRLRKKLNINKGVDIVSYFNSI